MVRVGIIGASGYTGAELLRLAAGHPEYDVVMATGDTQAGTRAASLYPSLAVHYPSLFFTDLDPPEPPGPSGSRRARPRLPRPPARGVHATGAPASRPRRLRRRPVRRLSVEGCVA